MQGKIKLKSICKYLGSCKIRKIKVRLNGKPLKLLYCVYTIYYRPKTNGNYCTKTINIKEIVSNSSPRDKVSNSSISGNCMRLGPDFSVIRNCT